MVKKKFNINYDDVLTKAYIFHSELVKNLSEFSAFSSSFASPFADNFLADIQTADDFPTYGDDLNSQAILTIGINEYMETARLHYKKLLFFVGLAWSNSEAILKIFGNDVYPLLRNSPQMFADLIHSSYLEADSAEYKTDLIAAGFSQADITMLNTVYTELKSRIDAQSEFIRHSSSRTEERLMAFNKIWDSMVMISSASKLIFRESPALIKFFLLYPDAKNNRKRKKKQADEG